MRSTNGRSIGTEQRVMPTTLTTKVMSVSWIPAGAVTGLPRKVFDIGLARYDPPPPDRIDDLGNLRATNSFRFANVLEVCVEVEDGRLVNARYAAGSTVVMGSTKLWLGSRDVTYSAVAAPVLQHDPEYRDDGSVRLAQTCGGRARTPTPRPVPHLPFVVVRSPRVWTTLALTVRPDGASEVELVSASTFPQHWVYDAAGRLALESDPPAYSTWLAHSFGPRTPWG